MWTDTSRCLSLTLTPRSQQTEASIYDLPLKWSSTPHSTIPLALPSSIFSTRQQPGNPADRSLTVVAVLSTVERKVQRRPAPAHTSTCTRLPEARVKHYTNLALFGETELRVRRTRLILCSSCTRNQKSARQERERPLTEHPEF